MLVEFPNPPSEATRVLKESLADITEIIKNDPVDNAPFQVLASAEIELLYPHQVYFTRLDDLGAGNGLKNAIAIGWRYFIKSKMSDDVLIGETRTNPATGGHSFCKLCRNRCQGDVLGAFLAAAQNRELPDEDLQGRLLYAPGLRLSALWLNNKSNRGDIFVPLPQIPEFLEARNYLEAEFLHTITENAQIAISQDTQTGI